MEGRSLTAALVLSGLIVIATGTALLFAGGPPPAPPRPKAPSPSDVPEALKLSATVYRATLEQDARIYGLPPVRPEDMARPFPYFNEGEPGGGERRLKVGSSMQTPHLKLSLLVKKEAGSMEGQTFRADHLVLRIENLTDRDLAYRIETHVADDSRCDTKGATAHNAIVIGPRDTVQRTECLYRKDERVAVRSIEVMEIPKLSTFYVSRLSPGLVLYSPRTSAGHVPPKGGLCPQTFSWREIREGAERGEIGWRDVIDFYGRHNCEDYVFFGTYRYRTAATAPLPARASP